MYKKKFNMDLGTFIKLHHNLLAFIVQSQLKYHVYLLHHLKGSSDLYAKVPTSIFIAPPEV